MSQKVLVGTAVKVRYLILQITANKRQLLGDLMSKKVWLVVG